MTTFVLTEAETPNQFALIALLHERAKVFNISAEEYAEAILESMQGLRDAD